MLFRRTDHLPGVIGATKRVQKAYVQWEKIRLSLELWCMLLDIFKRTVISHLVAADDGRELHDPMEPYFRAFTGAFDPDMPFTFYFEFKNKPIMLVYDATPIDRRSSHAAFIAQCDSIKSRILPITDYIQELANTGCLRAIPLDFQDRPPLPPDYANHWRKYKQFYNDVMTGLSFVCCSRLSPTQKLYDVWLKFNPEMLVNEKAI
jgi:hypothetical protein